MSLELFRNKIQQFSYPIRELALESERLYRPADEFVYNPYFKPLQLFKTPKRYWDGIKLENGDVSYGETALETVIFVEEIAFGDPSLYLALPGPNLSAALVASLGTRDQQDKFFGHFLNEVSWSAFSLTEPNAGSDAVNLKTTALKQSNGSFKLTGTKQYIANGAFSDWFIVFASIKSHDESEKNTNSLFIETFLFHEKDSHQILKTYDKTLGQRAARLGKIEFNDYQAAPESILGYDKRPLKRGFRGALSTFYHMRPATAAIAIGTSRAAIEYVETHQSLTLSEEIQLAKLKWKLDRGRLLTLNAAKQCDQGVYSSKSSSLAKQYMNKLVLEITRYCLKITGYDGMQQHPLLEKWMRDAHMIEFMEGSTNIHKLEVGRQLIINGV